MTDERLDADTVLDPSFAPPSRLHVRSLQPEQIAAFCARPWVSSLNALHVYFPEGLGSDGAAELAAAPFTSLRSLAIVNSKLTAPQLKTILASPHLAQIEELVLKFNGKLGAAGAKVLAAWPPIRTLRSLDLARCAMAWKDVKPLLGSPQLTTLSLSELRIGDDGAAGVAQLAAPLTSLDLMQCEVRDAGAEALIASSHQLTYLRLAGSLFDDDAVIERLQQRFGDALQL